MDKILLLQTLPGYGLQRIKKFLEINSLFLEDDKYFYKLLSRDIDRPIQYYIDKVNRIKQSCDELGVKIVPCLSPKIVDSPLLLYIKGDWKLLNEDRILGVIGTRRPSRAYIELGRDLTKWAVRCGWITISGLALGCDTIAYKETIRCGGKTIAVIPKGYQKNLAPEIINSGGLIVSEYPPNSPIKKYRCIKRNRILTGYSKALYVIESNKGGGSEISLNYAYKKSLPVAYSSGFSGIKKYGATKVKSCNEFDLFLKKCIN